MSPGLHIFQTGSTPSRLNNTYIKWIAVYSDSKASSHCLASKPAVPAADHRYSIMADDARIDSARETGNKSEGSGYRC
jgi:hypothetical protein